MATEVPPPVPPTEEVEQVRRQLALEVLGLAHLGELADVGVQERLGHARGLEGLLSSHLDGEEDRLEDGMQCLVVAHLCR